MCFSAIGGDTATSASGCRFPDASFGVRPSAFFFVPPRPLSVRNGCTVSHVTAATGFFTPNINLDELVENDRRPPHADNDGY